MPALPPISNPLRPRVSRSWIPPIRFRTKPYLKLSESLSAALDELEARFPSHRTTVIEERQMQQLRRKPRQATADFAETPMTFLACPERSAQNIMEGMKVLLASPRGFCAGVNMAIESLELALGAFGPPIYVYHEIVHNQYVVGHFRDRGVTFVDDLADVPEGATLLFSAHGVSPEIRRLARERKLRAIDATCPLVTKVHLEAIKYAQAGYTILLIGHQGHDEVIGTMGEAPEAIVLVETPEEVAALTVADENKVAYLTQTTLSVDDANRIIGRLKERFPKIVSPPTEDICYATQNRQEAVSRLSEGADLVLVLGSQNSSNSQRLAELARERGIAAHLIDGPDDIEPNWFQGVNTVLVTAGASAPEVVVDECLNWLRDRFGATVEPRSIREESVSFPLPRELRGVAIGNAAD